MKIQETYYDALYFASSYLAEGKDFHITLGEKDVLLKLINYSKKKAEITYPNSVIAKHTFKKYDTIKHSITRLGKKGYIKIDSTPYNDGDGFKRNRVITINWEKIAKIESLIGEIELHNSDSIISDLNEDIEESISTIQEEEIVQPEPSNEVYEEENDIIETLTKYLNDNCSSFVARVPIQLKIEKGELISEKEIYKLIPDKFKKEIA